MTKQATIELLGKQLPGFYSVEQVINMINDIEDSETSTFEFHSDSIRELSNTIASALDNEGIDIINDYDLTINGREVEIDSIDFSTSRIRGIVEEALEDFAEQLKKAE